MVMRVSVLGVGDLTLHAKLLGTDINFFYDHLDKWARFLAGRHYELTATPDRGITFYLPKKFVEISGRSVFGIAPVSDKEFGVKHLEKYMNAEVDGIPVYSPIIDTISWFKHNFLMPLTGDISLVFGLTLGTTLELSGSLYMYKLLSGKKPNINGASLTSVMDIIRAGEKVPFTIFVYKPFMLSDLPIELYRYAEHVGARIIKIKSPEEMENYL